METTIAALRVFVATAETGYLEQAGKLVGRSPSAVSMTLKQLGEEVGGDLFVSDRKNQLTELGLFLLESAKSQLLYYERSMSAVQAFAQGKIGKLELACVPSIATQLLPGLVEQFISKWPDVEMDIRDTDSSSIARSVQQGIVEIGIAGRPGNENGVIFQPVFKDRLVVLVPQGNKLSEQIPVPWSALKNQTIISNGIISKLQINELKKLNQNSRLMVRNTISLLALVRAKVGITILPELSVPQEQSEIMVLPLEDEQLTREVGILYRSDAPLSTVALTFIKLFEEYMSSRLNSKRELIWNVKNHPNA